MRLSKRSYYNICQSVHILFHRIISSSSPILDFPIAWYLCLYHLTVVNIYSLHFTVLLWMLQQLSGKYDKSRNEWLKWFLPHPSFPPFDSHFLFQTGGSLRAIRLWKVCGRFIDYSIWEHSWWWKFEIICLNDTILLKCSCYYLLLFVSKQF